MVCPLRSRVTKVEPAQRTGAQEMPKISLKGTSYLMMRGVLFEFGEDRKSVLARPIKKRSAGSKQKGVITICASALNVSLGFSPLLFEIIEPDRLNFSSTVSLRED